MEWTVSFQSDQRIVIVETRGDADDKGSLEMSKVIAKTMIEYKATRCLIDHSGLSSVSGNPSGMYFRPKGIIDGGAPHTAVIAEVVLPAHRKHFEFLETVFRNNGMLFRVFDDRASALQWLME
jgi:hypothetical protein